MIIRSWNSQYQNKYCFWKLVQSNEDWFPNDETSVIEMNESFQREPVVNGKILKKTMISLYHFKLTYLQIYNSLHNLCMSLFLWNINTVDFLPKKCDHWQYKSLSERRFILLFNFILFILKLLIDSLDI